MAIANGLEPSVVGVESGQEKKTDELKQYSRFRTALPQVLASTAKNLLLLDLGMTIAFPTIVIPALLNNTDVGGLTFTKEQASWLGSIAFICQPVGSILSGIILEPLGRKNSMMVVNLPHIIGWFLLYSASSHFMLYTAIVIMGLGVGFMEAPIITYVGEISEPKLRGILTSYAGLFVSIGFIVIYILGSITDWRTAAGISAGLPIATILAISQVPETPYWLLSRGRLADAEKSLCWLRGWLKPCYVQAELNAMVRYSEASKFSKVTQMSFSTGNDGNEDRKGAGLGNENPAYEPSQLDDKEKVVETEINVDSTNKVAQHGSNHAKEGLETISAKGGMMKDKMGGHEFVNIDLRSNNNTVLTGVVEEKLTWMEKLADVTRPEMLRPLSLVLAMFFFANATGVSSIRPYMVRVFEEFNLPIEAHHATVVVSVFGFAGSVCCMILVSHVGKRPISLFSCAGSVFASVTLSVIALNAPVSPQWTTLLLFTLLFFCQTFGMASIAWMLVSEVFPYRGRSLASGIAAAFSYILQFVATKTYLSLETFLGLGGVFLVYSVCSGIGFLFLYLHMPETEGKSLEQIEQGYSTKKNGGAL